MNTFCAANHKYSINGRDVPGVTSILRDLIPGWSASDWYLERGRIVHQCAAGIARGKRYDTGSQIDGQVAALCRFFAEVKPVIKDIERQVYSERYQYGGTLDGIFGMPKGNAVIDWKSSIDGRAVWQLAAYASAYEEMGNKKIDLGYAVQISDDGKYRMSEPYDLRIPKREWLSLLAVFNIRKRLKINVDTD